MLKKVKNFYWYILDSNYNFTTGRWKSPYGYLLSSDLKVGREKAPLFFLFNANELILFQSDLVVNKGLMPLPRKNLSKIKVRE